MNRLFLGIAAIVCIMSLTARGVDMEASRANIVLSEEMADARQWLDRRLDAVTGNDIKSIVTIRGVSQGWGRLQLGLQVNKLPIKLNGKVYETGIGSHADAEIQLLIPSGAKRLTGICGIDDTPEARDAKHPVFFTIEADGKEIWKSGNKIASDDPEKFDIDLAGVSILTLRATGVVDRSYTPVDWADLKLVSADGTVHELGKKREFIDGQGGFYGFTYDKKLSQDFIGEWKPRNQEIAEDEKSITRKITRTDPATGLMTTIDIKQYKDYPVVEWTMHCKNTGSADTPILEKIKSMDLAFPAGGKLLLHHNTGDHDAPNGYEPHVTELIEGQTLHFAPNGGRPTDLAWPYFNLEDPDANRGFIAVVAWPGQWSAEFSRSTLDGGTLNLSAGQELTHLVLRPGEEIRTPLSVMMFYRGDAVRAQNMWRRWMIDHNTPRPHGKLPPAIFATATSLYQTAKGEIEAMDKYIGHGAKLNHWWLDAGWYPCEQWWQVGTWEPDPKRFPNGVKEVSDAAHKNNLQLILWLEPERVRIDTWLDKNHPEWLLGKPGDSRVLNLGNPDAWKWIVERVDNIITQQGVDLYRQDFNMEALAAWRGNDAPDRQGMTEIRHVEGYLAFWDELRRRHPDMLIDTCASGGRRLDLETLRRSIPLWRTDRNMINEVNQAMTVGLAQWLPFFGSGLGATDAYTVRGIMFTSLQLGETPDTQAGWDLFNHEYEVWMKFRDDLLGDFYPLLPYSLDNQAWMAWQYNRPELGRGVVQAFRRPDSPFVVSKFPLNGLDRNAEYVVTNLDLPDQPQAIKGSQLMDAGIEVRMETKPAATIFTYQKK